MEGSLAELELRVKNLELERANLESRVTLLEKYLKRLEELLATPYVDKKTGIEHPQDKASITGKVKFDWQG